MLKWILLFGKFCGMDGWMGELKLCTVISSHSNVWFIYSVYSWQKDGVWYDIQWENHRTDLYILWCDCVCICGVGSILIWKFIPWG